jgi:transcriptional regulator NrdR family protein
MNIDVIKRGGARPTESFSSPKLHASIQAACLSVHTPIGEAETIAKNVCDDVLAWLHDRPEVTSADIRRVATKSFETFHPEAAYLYKHHRLVL